MARKLAGFFREGLTVSRVLGTLMLAAGLLTILGVGIQVSLSGTDPAGFVPPSEPPNVIFILTDDLDARSAEHLPALQRELVGEGTAFSNAFVTHPWCCPSRASILTGQYTHNHRVLSNHAPSGGSLKFRTMGHENSNIATWLKDGGYQTVLIGKYLNAYGDEDPTHVLPGWDEWYALAGPKTPYYDYYLDENGELVYYGGEEEDYQTDVLARKATDYVERATGDPEGRPFFMYLAPKAPHSPYEPAPRHRGTFEDAAKAPRPPSFDEEDVSDKPSWVPSQKRMSSRQISQIDRAYRKRLQMMLAVDDMVSGIVETLRESGELENTYIVFASDNGYQMGEHRLDLKKRTAYEESIRIPLIMRGPGVPAGRVVDQLALNTDLAPTFAELAGVGAPDTVDGRSLTPLLAGEPPAAWRSAFLVEHWQDGTGKIPDYGAVRTVESEKYVEYATGERELYDLSADPYELENFHEGADPDLVEPLRSRLADLKDCSGETCRAAEDGP